MRRPSLADVESAAPFLDKDDLDNGRPSWTELSDTEGRSSSSSTDASSAYTVSGESHRRPRWLRATSLRGLRRWRTDPRCLLFAAVATCVMLLVLCNPYLPAEQRPVNSIVAWITSFGREDGDCTTWPVGEDGKLIDSSNLAPREQLELDTIAPHGGWKKPEGIKIVGMVFFGRKRTVDVLDCYLHQNLAANGGYVDEFWFMVHTDVKDDMAWLEELVSKNPGVYKMVGKGVCDQGRSYECLWSYAVEDKTMYIKIDDDIVYIHPDAIPQLVHTRINVPHPFAIAGNLVNSPMTGMRHYHYGAIHPFMPEAENSTSREAGIAWRPSKKPQLQRRDKPDPEVEAKIIDGIIHLPVPFPGHTWHMSSEDHFDLLETPMGIYDQHGSPDLVAFGPAWESWAIGAQQQYSLLHNLEQNRMDRYFFGRKIEYPAHAKTANASSIIPPIKGGPGGEQTYDTGFTRYNVNFMALWGSDIREQLPIAWDDEQDFSVTIPKRTRRPILIDTRSVVSHYSFYIQLKSIRQTDLLDRYRALANEAACPANRLKVPFDGRCAGF
ncbi:hypothetical protein Micbo1qcDRAFT_205428 [Microdochium bolleyi]|uniref:Uncharacterized protein n=1 Tax=Microdochium bolleyi TaxID=196109 RepID=A0A136J072_9PEZI|nr:hypothetical protein Micbo1qcDRAFT_205428 [Microdochium bolleyi]